MQSLLNLIDAILGLYWFVVIMAVIASWLVSFRVINSYHPLVGTILNALYSLTEPVFSRIRRAIPFLSVGGLDFTPIVVLLLIYFLRSLVGEYGPQLLM
ncbi:MAG: YggT family protein [Pseudomonadota bacterium]